MFAVALVVRLLIAPYSGYYGDLKIFRAWAMRLDDVGFDDFYGAGWADYPPGYLYVLWLIGKASAHPSWLLLKLPAILGDLALAWIASAFAIRLAPSSLAERVPLRVLVAGAILFNPAVIMLSAVWGQVDVVPTVFVLSSLYLLFTGPQSLHREIGALLVFAVAVAMKPQACFVLPVMLYALYRRHLRGRRGGDLARGGLSLAIPASLSVGLWAASGVPFGLNPIELVRFLRESASLYSVTSANAFNLWGIVGFWRHDSPGFANSVSVGGLPAFYVGLMLFAVGAAVVLWRTHNALGRGADEALVLTVAAAATALLAFAVLTRMHERYMFYPLALLAAVVIVRQLRWTYAAVSGLFVLNLWWVYAYSNSRGDLGHPCALPFPGCVGFDSIFGGFATDTWQKKVWSAAFTAIAFIVAWFGARWAEGTKRSTGDSAPLTASAQRRYSRATPSPAGSSAARDRQMNTRSPGSALSDNPAD